MNVVEKTKQMLALSPDRIPNKLKSFKRWRMSLTDLENYLENIAGFDNKELDLTNSI